MAAGAGPPAFVSAASAVFDLSPELLRRAKRNEAITSAIRLKDLPEANAEAEEQTKSYSSLSSRQQLFRLAQASIRRQHWRADLLHSHVPTSVPLLDEPTAPPPSSPSSSAGVYRRVVLRYGQLQHKARKLRQLDACRVANTHTIATLVAAILAEKSPSFSFGPETISTVYGSSSSATLPNAKPTASVAVADCTLGLSAPQRRLLSRPVTSKSTTTTTTTTASPINSSLSGKPRKVVPTMSTQPTRRSTPRTPPAPGPVVPTGLSLLQQRMRRSKELDARAAQSCLEEATFWRWVESAAKEEEEEEEDERGDEGARNAGGGETDASWARLHAQVGSMVPMMAQLEAATSLLFASGAVRPTDMEAIAARTQREVRESGITEGGEAQATGNSRDWTRHPGYASLLALYADATPRSVSGALSALREGHASTLSQAHHACEAAACPFEFVFDSDVVRLGKVQRGQG